MAARDANGDFESNRRLILFRLDRLDEEVSEVKASCARMELELAGLRLKASLWGAVAGAIPGLVTAAALLIKWHGA